MSRLVTLRIGSLAIAGTRSSVNRAYEFLQKRPPNEPKSGLADLIHTSKTETAKQGARAASVPEISIKLVGERGRYEGNL
jgi:hypothetical protein